MRASASLLGWLLPPATVLVIIMVAVLTLMTPSWMHWAIGAAGGTLPRETPEVAYLVSDRTVSEMLLGPGTFHINGCSDLHKGCVSFIEGVYTPDEAAHLRDARLVLYLFLGLALVSAAFIAAALLRAPRDARRWRAVARGGSVLAIAVVLLGVVGALAFDAAFELFHRVFFPGGNWAFAADSNMIRLYPYPFWQLTVVALGVLCLLFGAVVWWVGRRQARRLEANMAR